MAEHILLFALQVQKERKKRCDLHLGEKSLQDAKFESLLYR